MVHDGYRTFNGWKLSIVREIITANEFILPAADLFHKKNKSIQILFKRKLARDGSEISSNFQARRFQVIY
jgi:hypothetical protein